MARIAGVDIPRDKRVEISLTYIYGVGRTTSQKILEATQIDPNLRVRDLDENQLTRLREYIDRNYTVEGGYIGRFGRDMLIRRDLAMPLNLVDPASRMDYFTAAQTIIRAAQNAGLASSSPASAYAGLPALAYWENIFPAAAGGGLTATQAITRAFMQNGPDWITALYDMDTRRIVQTVQPSTRKQR